MKPYICPACQGKTTVPAGFYSGHGETVSVSSTAPEQCRSCRGAGYVLCPCSEPLSGPFKVTDTVPEKPGEFPPFAPPFRWEWNPNRLEVGSGSLTVPHDPTLRVWWGC